MDTERVIKLLQPADSGSITRLENNELPVPLFADLQAQMQQVSIPVKVYHPFRVKVYH